MRALGARIVNTPREDGMLGAAAKAEELLGQIPNSIALRRVREPAWPTRRLTTRLPVRRSGATWVAALTTLLRGLAPVARTRAWRAISRSRTLGLCGRPCGPSGLDHGWLASTVMTTDIEGIGNDFVAKTMDMSAGGPGHQGRRAATEAFSASRLIARGGGNLCGLVLGRGALREPHTCRPPCREGRARATIADGLSRPRRPILLEGAIRVGVRG